MISGRKCRRNSSTTVETTNSEEEKCAGDSGHRLSSAGMSKMLSRSRSSLHEETAGKASRSPSNTRSDSFVPNKFKQSDSPGVLSQASLNPNGDTYFLPKDYKPEQALEILEKKHAFFSKTFGGCRTDSLEKNTNDLVPEPAGNFEETYKTKWGEFSSNFPKENQNGKFEDQIVCNFVDIISTRRVKELKVLGCLIVEIFMAKQLKCLGSSSRDLTLDSRIENCIAMTRHSDNSLPPCISYIVDLLLRPNEYDRNDPFSSTHPPITPTGLPPPTARLLLEPLLHHPLPFSRHQPSLYRLLADLKRFESVASELDVLYHFDCAGGEMCAQYEALEKTRILLQRNIAECQVKGCVGELEGLLGEVDTNTESEVIGIILPYIKQLMENPPTSVLAAWYLFEPLSRVLGPRKSAKYLLPPLLKLYENEPDHSHLPYLGKIARLYHHSFLLCLMVRLGLRCFLDKFVVALVEAVGGYKDRELVDFVLHDHSGRVAKRASHLKGIEAEEGERSSSEESNNGRGERESAVEEVFELEEEKNSEEQIKFLIDHLQLNVASELTFNHSIEEAFEANTSEESGVRSPTIPIPTSKTTLSHISCEVGSKKSEKSELELDFEVSELPKVSARGSESPRVSARGKPKISETSSDSLLWLSHRLGPLLTAKYLSRNLLKMLALCYIGRENLTGCVLAVGGSLGGVSIAGGYVVGDEAAGKVLECLSSISGLYGEQIILYQYIPYMTEMILLCKKRLTPNLEGGLISCLALLKYIIPYFTDVMLMDQLQDVILKNILHPIVRLLNSTEHTFPSGYFSRNTLARKYLDVIYVLSIRIGTDMTKKYLVVPALQRFFLIFDKVYDRKNDMYVDKISLAQPNIDPKIENEKPTPDSPSSEKLNDDCSLSEETNLTNETLKEIKEVFTPELAYTAYLPFINLVGSGFLEVSLKNHENVRNLCQEYEESLLNSGGQDKLKLSNFPRSQSITSTSSIGSNVAMIGNRIDVQPEVMDNLNMDLLSLVRNRVESSTRHLRGNWLAYWESEIGRSEKNRALNFKQIKLQTFVGHTQSVKCLYALDNENSFLSGSRDKTVKLWSLRSQGDGSTTSNCQWTYSAHRKSILSITFVESLRLVASCDSVVHIWDPFMGANLGSLESAKYAPVNVLRSMPAPSTLVFAATTDGTIKIIDTRLLDYVQEIKISLNPSGLIRCLAVAPCGTWVAAGQSSGAVTVLDTRTGLVVSNWRAHESEVLQLAVGDEDLLISTSLDQNVCVWSVADGKFKFQMRGTTEPVHCLNVNNNELISGTTANRIGVHSSIAPDAAFSNNKLRTDTFRGLLTSMDYLPLNRLLLLGADTGNINLLC
ncbi:unnamed protein product [Phaedon cochleariae]|uniref:Uncharacterized protein n=1 Tax=Phaedon cochleariae TaxID=80249 RepID=A0A9N9SCF8_PHACE|nr:unnamed protein product [Phaedon cochleariae]